MPVKKKVAKKKKVVKKVVKKKKPASSTTKVKAKSAGTIRTSVRLKIRNRTDKTVTLFKVEKSGLTKAMNDSFLKELKGAFPTKPIRGGNKTQLIIKIDKKPVYNAKTQVGASEEKALKNVLFN